MMLFPLLHSKGLVTSQISRQQNSFSKRFPYKNSTQIRNKANEVACKTQSQQLHLLHCKWKKVKCTSYIIYTVEPNQGQ
jgi:hypothetical protein